MESSFHDLCPECPICHQHRHGGNCNYTYCVTEWDSGPTPNSWSYEVTSSSGATWYIVINDLGEARLMGSMFVPADIANANPSILATVRAYAARHNHDWL